MRNKHSYRLGFLIRLIAILVLECFIVSSLAPGDLIRNLVGPYDVALADVRVNSDYLSPPLAIGRQGRQRGVVSEAEKLKSSKLVLQIAAEFGLDVKDVRLEVAGGNVEDESIPVIITPDGEFAIKRLKVEGIEDARFVMDYVRYLQGEGIPIPTIYKAETTGEAADDYFSVFDLEQKEERYYSVERWVKGKAISRKDAKSATLKAVGSMLGKIHSLSKGYVSQYERHQEHYSFEAAIAAINDPKWRKKLESTDFTQEELALADITLSEVSNYWTDERLTQLEKYFHVMPSDMNFGNIVFDETGEEIIAIFDWDNVRIGYRFEDFFATLIQTGRRGEGLHVGELQKDLNVFLKGYQATDYLFTQEEIDTLPMHYVAQLLYRIMLNANKLIGDADHDTESAEMARWHINGLREIRTAFGLEQPDTLPYTLSKIRVATRSMGSFKSKKPKDCDIDSLDDTAFDERSYKFKPNEPARNEKALELDEIVTASSDFLRGALLPLIEDVALGEDKAIIGLGNSIPDVEGFETTPHNLGHMTIEVLADYFNVELKAYKDLRCKIAEVKLEGGTLYLIQNDTDINFCGAHVRRALSYLGDPECITVCDEMSRPLGAMELQSGDTRHNGIVSLKNNLGEDTPILVIGADIGKKRSSLPLVKRVIQKYPRSMKGILVDTLSVAALELLWSVSDEEVSSLAAKAEDLIGRMVASEDNGTVVEIGPEISLDDRAFMDEHFVDRWWHKDGIPPEAEEGSSSWIRNRWAKLCGLLAKKSKEESVWFQSGGLREPFLEFHGGHVPNLSAGHMPLTYLLLALKGEDIPWDELRLAQSYFRAMTGYKGHPNNIIIPRSLPKGLRAATCQECVRPWDMTNIDRNDRTGFFEMLANWALLSGNIEEYIQFIFDFLIEEVGVSKENIHVTYFSGGTVDYSREGIDLADVYIPQHPEILKAIKALNIPKEHLHEFGKDQDPKHKRGALWVPGTDPHKINGHTMVEFGQSTEFFVWLGKEPYNPEEDPPPYKGGKNWLEIGNVIATLGFLSSDGALGIDVKSEGTVDFYPIGVEDQQWKSELPVLIEAVTSVERAQTLKYAISRGKDYHLFAGSDIYWPAISSNPADIKIGEDVIAFNYEKAFFSSIVTAMFLYESGYNLKEVDSALERAVRTARDTWARMTHQTLTAGTIKLVAENIAKLYSGTYSFERPGLIELFAQKDISRISNYLQELAVGKKTLDDVQLGLSFHKKHSRLTKESPYHGYLFGPVGIIYYRARAIFAHLKPGPAFNLLCHLLEQAINKGVDNNIIRDALKDQKEAIIGRIGRPLTQDVEEEIWNGYIDVVEEQLYAFLREIPQIKLIRYLPKQARGLPFAARIFLVELLNELTLYEFYLLCSLFANGKEEAELIEALMKTFGFTQDEAKAVYGQMINQDILELTKAVKAGVVRRPTYAIRDHFLKRHIKPSIRQSFIGQGVKLGRYSSAIIDVLDEETGRIITKRLRNKGNNRIVPLIRKIDAMGVTPDPEYTLSPNTKRTPLDNFLEKLASSATPATGSPYTIFEVLSQAEKPLTVEEIIQRLPERRSEDLIKGDLGALKQRNLVHREGLRKDKDTTYELTSSARENKAELLKLLYKMVNEYGYRPRSEHWILYEPEIAKILAGAEGSFVDVGVAEEIVEQLYQEIQEPCRIIKDAFLEIVAEVKKDDGIEWEKIESPLKEMRKNIDIIHEFNSEAMEAASGYRLKRLYDKLGSVFGHNIGIVSWAVELFEARLDAGRFETLKESILKRESTIPNVVDDFFEILSSSNIVPEEERGLSKENIEEVQKAIAYLFSNTHDICNPLSALTGRLGMRILQGEIVERVQEADDLKTAVAEILEDLLSMNYKVQVGDIDLKTIVEEIKDLAKSSEEKFRNLEEQILSFNVISKEQLEGAIRLLEELAALEEIVIKEVSDVKTVLSECCDSFVNFISKNVVIKQNYPDGEVLAEIDKIKITHALENLINNAIKAIERKGTITVSLEVVNGEIKITISDTGKGMPHELIDRFRAGVKGHDITTKPPEKGEVHGLGLYNVRKIVEAHDGSIDIESVTGKGTAFTIILPIIPTQASHVYKEATEEEKAALLEKLTTQVSKYRLSYIERFKRGVAWSSPYVKLSFLKSDKEVKLHPKRVYHEGLIKDEDGVYWIVKKFDDDAVIPYGESRTEKNFPRKEMLAYLVARGVANFNEIRFLTDEEASNLSFIEGDINDYYLTRLVATSNIDTSTLAHNDMEEAYIGIFVATVLMRKFDQHLGNFAYVDGIPISLDNVEVFGYEDFPYTKEDFYRFIFALLDDHMLIRFVHPRIESRVAFDESVDYLRTARVDAKEDSDEYMIAFNTLRGMIENFGLGEGLTVAQLLKPKNIREIILQCKDISNIRELAMMAGYEGEDLDRTVEYFTNCQASLGNDINEIWKLLTGEDAGFDKLDKPTETSLVVKIPSFDPPIGSPYTVFEILSELEDDEAITVGELRNKIKERYGEEREISTYLADLGALVVRGLVHRDGFAKDTDTTTYRLTHEAREDKSAILRVLFRLVKKYGYRPKSGEWLEFEPELENILSKAQIEEEESTPVKTISIRSSSRDPELTNWSDPETVTLHHFRYGIVERADYERLYLYMEEVLDEIWDVAGVDGSVEKPKLVLIEEELPDRFVSEDSIYASLGLLREIRKHRTNSDNPQGVIYREDIAFILAFEIAYCMQIHEGLNMKSQHQIHAAVRDADRRAFDLMESAGYSVQHVFDIFGVISKSKSYHNKGFLMGKIQQMIEMIHQGKFYELFKDKSSIEIMEEMFDQFLPTFTKVSGVALSEEQIESLKEVLASRDVERFVGALNKFKLDKQKVKDSVTGKLESIAEIDYREEARKIWESRPRPMEQAREVLDEKGVSTPGELVDMLKEDIQEGEVGTRLSEVGERAREFIEGDPLKTAQEKTEEIMRQSLYLSLMSQIDFLLKQAFAGLDSEEGILADQIRQAQEVVANSRLDEMQTIQDVVDFTKKLSLVVLKEETVDFIYETFPGMLYASLLAEFRDDIEVKGVSLLDKKLLKGQKEALERTLQSKEIASLDDMSDIIRDILGTVLKEEITDFVVEETLPAYVGFRFTNATGGKLSDIQRGMVTKIAKEAKVTTGYDVLNVIRELLGVFLNKYLVNFIFGKIEFAYKTFRKEKLGEDISDDVSILTEEQRLKISELVSSEAISIPQDISKFITSLITELSDEDTAQFAMNYINARVKIDYDAENISSENLRSIQSLISSNGLQTIEDISSLITDIIRVVAQIDEGLSKELSIFIETGIKVHRMGLLSEERLSSVNKVLDPDRVYSVTDIVGIITSLLSLIMNESTASAIVGNVFGQVESTIDSAIEGKVPLVVKKQAGKIIRDAEFKTNEDIVDFVKELSGTVMNKQAVDFLFGKFNLAGLTDEQVFSKDQLREIRERLNPKQITHIEDIMDLIRLLLEMVMSSYMADFTMSHLANTLEMKSKGKLSVEQLERLERLLKNPPISTPKELVRFVFELYRIILRKDRDDPLLSALRDTFDSTIDMIQKRELTAPQLAEIGNVIEKYKANEALEREDIISLIEEVLPIVMTPTMMAAGWGLVADRFEVLLGLSSDGRLSAKITKMISEAEIKSYKDYLDLITELLRATMDEKLADIIINQLKANSDLFFESSLGKRIPRDKIPQIKAILDKADTGTITNMMEMAESLIGVIGSTDELTSQLSGQAEKMAKSQFDQIAKRFKFDLPVSTTKMLMPNKKQKVEKIVRETEINDVEDILYMIEELLLVIMDEEDAKAKAAHIRLQLSPFVAFYKRTGLSARQLRAIQDKLLSIDFSTENDVSKLIYELVSIVVSGRVESSILDSITSDLSAAMPISAESELPKKKSNRALKIVNRADVKTIDDALVLTRELLLVIMEHEEADAVIDALSSKYESVLEGYRKEGDLPSQIQDEINGICHSIAEINTPDEIVDLIRSVMASLVSAKTKGFAWDELENRLADYIPTHSGEILDSDKKEKIEAILEEASYEKPEDVINLIKNLVEEVLDDDTAATIVNGLSSKSELITDLYGERGLTGGQVFQIKEVLNPKKLVNINTQGEALELCYEVLQILADGQLEDVAMDELESLFSKVLPENSGEVLTDEKRELIKRALIQASFDSPQDIFNLLKKLVDVTMDKETSTQVVSGLSSFLKPIVKVYGDEGLTPEQIKAIDKIIGESIQEENLEQLKTSNEVLIIVFEIAKILANEKFEDFVFEEIANELDPVLPESASKLFAAEKRARIKTILRERDIEEPKDVLMVLKEIISVSVDEETADALFSDASRQLNPIIKMYGNEGLSKRQIEKIREELLAIDYDSPDYIKDLVGSLSGILIQGSVRHFVSVKVSDEVKGLLESGISIMSTNSPEETKQRLSRILHTNLKRKTESYIIFELLEVILDPEKAWEVFKEMASDFEDEFKIWEAQDWILLKDDLIYESKLEMLEILRLNSDMNTPKDILDTAGSLMTVIVKALTRDAELKRVDEIMEELVPSFEDGELTQASRTKIEDLMSSQKITEYSTLFDLMNGLLSVVLEGADGDRDITARDIVIKLFEDDDYLGWAFPERRSSNILSSEQRDVIKEVLENIGYIDTIGDVYDVIYSIASGLALTGKEDGATNRLKVRLSSAIPKGFLLNNSLSEAQLEKLDKVIKFINIDELLVIIQEVFGVIMEEEAANRVFDKFVMRYEEVIDRCRQDGLSSQQMVDIMEFIRSPNDFQDISDVSDYIGNIMAILMDTKTEDFVMDQIADAISYQAPIFTAEVLSDENRKQIQKIIQEAEFKKVEDVLEVFHNLALLTMKREVADALLVDMSEKVVSHVDMSQGLNKDQAERIRKVFEAVDFDDPMFMFGLVNSLVPILLEGIIQKNIASDIRDDLLEVLTGDADEPIDEAEYERLREMLDIDGIEHIDEAIALIKDVLLVIIDEDAIDEILSKIEEEYEGVLAIYRDEGLSEFEIDQFMVIIKEYYEDISVRYWHLQETSIRAEPDKLKEYKDIFELAGLLFASLLHKSMQDYVLDQLDWRMGTLLPRTVEEILSPDKKEAIRNILNEAEFEHPRDVIELVDKVLLASLDDSSVVYRAVNELSGRLDEIVNLYGEEGLAEDQIENLHLIIKKADLNEISEVVDFVNDLLEVLITEKFVISTLKGITERLQKNTMVSALTSFGSAVEGQVGDKIAFEGLSIPYFDTHPPDEERSSQLKTYKNTRYFEHYHDKPQGVPEEVVSEVDESTEIALDIEVLKNQAESAIIDRLNSKSNWQEVIFFMAMLDVELLSDELYQKVKDAVEVDVDVDDLERDIIMFQINFLFHKEDLNKTLSLVKDKEDLMRYIPVHPEAISDYRTRDAIYNEIYLPRLSEFMKAYNQYLYETFKGIVDSEDEPGKYVHVLIERYEKIFELGLIKDPTPFMDLLIGKLQLYSSVEKMSEDTVMKLLKLRQLVFPSNAALSPFFDTIIYHQLRENEGFITEFVRQEVGSLHLAETFYGALEGEFNNTAFLGLGGDYKETIESLYFMSFEMEKGIKKVLDIEGDLPFLQERFFKFWIKAVYDKFKPKDNIANYTFEFVNFISEFFNEREVDKKYYASVVTALSETPFSRGAMKKVLLFDMPVLERSSDIFSPKVKKREFSLVHVLRDFKEEDIIEVEVWGNPVWDGLLPPKEAIIVTGRIVRLDEDMVHWQEIHVHNDEGKEVKISSDRILKIWGLKSEIDLQETETKEEKILIYELDEPVVDRLRDYDRLRDVILAVLKEHNIKDGDTLTVVGEERFGSSYKEPEEYIGVASGVGMNLLYPEGRFGAELELLLEDGRHMYFDCRDIHKIFVHRKTTASGKLQNLESRTEEYRRAITDYLIKNVVADKEKAEHILEGEPEDWLDKLSMETLNLLYLLSRGVILEFDYLGENYLYKMPVSEAWVFYVLIKEYFVADLLSEFNLEVLGRSKPEGELEEDLVRLANSYATTSINTFSKYVFNILIYMAHLFASERKRGATGRGTLRLLDSTPEEKADESPGDKRERIIWWTGFHTPNTGHYGGPVLSDVFIGEIASDTNTPQKVQEILGDYDKPPTPRLRVEVDGLEDFTSWSLAKKQEQLQLCFTIFKDIFVKLNTGYTRYGLNSDLGWRRKLEIIVQCIPPSVFRNYLLYYTFCHDVLPSGGRKPYHTHIKRFLNKQNTKEGIRSVLELGIEDAQIEAARRAEKEKDKKEKSKETSKDKKPHVSPDIRKEIETEIVDAFNFMVSHFVKDEFIETLNQNEIQRYLLFYASILSVGTLDIVESLSPEEQDYYDGHEAYFEDLGYNELGTHNAYLDLQLGEYFSDYLIRVINAPLSYEVAEDKNVICYSFKEKLEIIEKIFPNRKSNRRDYYLQMLLDTMPMANIKTGMLRQIADLMNNVRRKDIINLELLEREIQAKGKVTFDEELDLITRYFPGRSYFRDDILMSFERKRVSTNKELAQVRSLLTSDVTTTTDEEVAKIQEVMDNVVALLSEVSAQTKIDVLLWILGAHGEKPDIIKKLELLTYSKFDHLFSSNIQTSQRKKPRYENVGAAERKVFLELLLLKGENSIIAGGHTADLIRQITHYVFEDLGVAGEEASRDLGTIDMKMVDLLISSFIKHMSHNPRRLSNILINLIDQLDRLNRDPAFENASSDKKLGMVMKSLLIAMGAVGIKLGQFLSTATVIKLPQEVRDELAELRSKATPIDKAAIFSVLSAVGRGDTIIERILGNASIKITLKVLGLDRVLKVKKLQVYYEAIEDVSLLNNIFKDVEKAGLMDKRDREHMVSEVERMIENESDFEFERQNAERLKQNYGNRNDSFIYRVFYPIISKVLGIRDYSFQFTLVIDVIKNMVIEEEFISAVALEDYKGDDKRSIYLAVAVELFREVLFDRFYHADPHPANIMVEEMSNGKTRIHFIDMGDAAETSVRDSLATITFLGLIAIMDELGLRGFSRVVRFLVEGIAKLIEPYVHPSMIKFFGKITYLFVDPASGKDEHYDAPVKIEISKLEEPDTKPIVVYQAKAPPIKLLEYMVQNEHYENNPVSREVLLGLGIFKANTLLSCTRSLERIDLLKSISDPDNPREKLYYLTRVFTVEQVEELGKGIPELYRYTIVDLPDSDMPKMNDAIIDVLGRKL